MKQNGGRSIRVSGLKGNGKKSGVDMDASWWYTGWRCMILVGALNGRLDLMLGIALCTEPYEAYTFTQFHRNWEVYP